MNDLETDRPQAGYLAHHLAHFAVGLPVILYSGWVASCLWAWFACPLGSPPIGAARAAGLLILLRMAVVSTRPLPHGAPIPGAIAEGIKAVIFCTLMLGTGLLFRLFA